MLNKDIHTELELYIFVCKDIKADTMSAVTRVSTRSHVK